MDKKSKNVSCTFSDDVRTFTVNSETNADPTRPAAQEDKSKDVSKGYFKSVANTESLPAKFISFETSSIESLSDSDNLKDRITPEALATILINTVVTEAVLTLTMTEVVGGRCLSDPEKINARVEDEIRRMVEHGYGPSATTVFPQDSGKEISFKTHRDAKNEMQSVCDNAELSIGQNNNKNVILDLQNGNNLETESFYNRVGKQNSNVQQNNLNNLISNQTHQGQEMQYNVRPDAHVTFNVDVYGRGYIPVATSPAKMATKRDVAVGSDVNLKRMASGDGEPEEVDGQQTTSEVTVNYAASPASDISNNIEQHGVSPPPPSPAGNNSAAASSNRSSSSSVLSSGSAKSSSSIPDPVTYEPPKRATSATSETDVKVSNASKTDASENTEPKLNKEKIITSNNIGDGETAADVKVTDGKLNEMSRTKTDEEEPRTHESSGQNLKDEEQKSDEQIKTENLRNQEIVSKEVNLVEVVSSKEEGTCEVQRPKTGQQGLENPRGVISEDQSRAPVNEIEISVEKEATISDETGKMASDALKLEGDKRKTEVDAVHISNENSITDSKEIVKESTSNSMTAKQTCVDESANETTEEEKTKETKLQAESGRFGSGIRNEIMERGNGRTSSATKALERQANISDEQKADKSKLEDNEIAISEKKKDLSGNTEAPEDGGKQSSSATPAVQQEKVKSPTSRNSSAKQSTIRKDEQENELVEDTGTTSMGEKDLSNAALEPGTVGITENGEQEDDKEQEENNDEEVEQDEEDEYEENEKEKDLEKAEQGEINMRSRSPTKRTTSSTKSGRNRSLPQLRQLPKVGKVLQEPGRCPSTPREGVSTTSIAVKSLKPPASPRKPQKSMSPRKKNGILSPIKTPKTPDNRKLPPIKAPVGLAPNPNLKNIKSKIGSFDNIKYKPGGGDKKVITIKLEWKAAPKICSLERTEKKSREKIHNEDGELKIPKDPEKEGIAKNGMDPVTNGSIEKTEGTISLPLLSVADRKDTALAPEGEETNLPARLTFTKPEGVANGSVGVVEAMKATTVF